MVVTGGCAKNNALIQALESKLGLPVIVPDNPLITGALGAALLARDMVVISGYKKTRDSAINNNSGSHRK